jgi:serralysin
MAMFCNCSSCAGSGADLAFAVDDGGGAAAKPSYDSLQAAQQITRNVSAIYLPSVPSPLAITYAYRETATAPAAPSGATNWIGGLNSDMGGFTPFNAQQITVMETMIQMVRDIANVTLTRVGTGTAGPGAYTDNAQFLIGNYTTGSATSYAGFGQYNFYKYSSGVYVRAGKVWTDGSEAAIASPSELKYAGRLFVHEFMHTLGLSHPGSYDVTKPGYSYDSNALYAEDTRQYSVMSYFDETHSGANWGNAEAMTPMIHDIAALQRLYGANQTTRTGDNTYGFNGNTGYGAMTMSTPTDQRTFAIWDAGGNDTIDLSGYSTASTINLNQEAFSSAGTRSDGGMMVNNISIARGVVIERAIGGAGSDTIIGNAAANSLVGDGGDDRMTGSGGNDAIDGGGGRDTAVYARSRADYTVTSNAPAVTVADRTAGRDGSDTLAGIERLDFADGTLALDIALPGQGASNAGSAYRLYEAAFNRSPDVAGLSFWINQLDSGAFARDRMAQGFVGSAEFRAVYGADPSAEALVNGFYRNILDRSPEKAGFDFWFGILNGRPDLRSSVLDAIANSPENQQGLLPVIGQGIWIPGEAIG